MNYLALANTANTLLKGVGMSCVITRGTTRVGTGYGVFVASEAKNETTSFSSVLAQTSLTERTLLLSGVGKEPLVGDVIAADKVDYLIKVVEKVRPTSTTLLYKISV